MSGSKVHMMLEPSILMPVWFAHSIEGLKESAAKQKKTLIKIDRLEDAEPDTPAVILVSTNNEWTLTQVDKCRKNGIRPILIGSDPYKYGEDVSGTRYSSKSSIEGLMRYFTACGRKRLALLGINEMGSNDIVKRDVFLGYAKQHHLPITSDDIYYRTTNSGQRNEAFFDAIQTYNGVICSNDYVAAFVLQYAEEHGLRVPEDLFVSGLGDSTLCRYTHPSLTSATRSYRKTGEQAYNIWKQISCDPETFSIVITVQCEIKPRGSTANAPLPPAEESFVEPASANSLPLNAMVQEEGAIRSLEMCLVQCDKTDILIIQGILQNQTVEALAEALYVSPGTVRYRLKKIFEHAHVTTRARFVALFSRYIRDSLFFEDFIREL